MVGEGACPKRKGAIRSDNQIAWSTPMISIFVGNRNARYIMERRFPDGTLDLRGQQPPFIECTEQQICSYFFDRDGKGPDGPPASQEVIAAWYRERGWTWREKTW